MEAGSLRHGSFLRDGFHEVADVEVVFGEVLVELIHRCEAEAVGGLLDEVVEEMLDEGSVCTGAFDGDFGEVGSAVDADGFVVRSGVVAGGVDGLLLFVGAEATDGVVVFQAKANRVDDGVAGHAAGVLGDLGDFFAHREMGLEVGVLEFDGVWRWLEETPEDVSTEVDPTVDGGGLLVVGKSGEDIGMGEEARAVFVGRDILEAPLWVLGAIEFGEAFVDGKLSREEELTVV